MICKKDEVKKLLKMKMDKYKLNLIPKMKQLNLKNKNCILNVLNVEIASRWNLIKDTMVKIVNLIWIIRNIK